MLPAWTSYPVARRDVVSFWAFARGARRNEATMNARTIFRRPGRAGRDQGTSSSQDALVVDETGSILATAQRAARAAYPRPGLVAMRPPGDGLALPPVGSSRIGGLERSWRRPPACQRRRCRAASPASASPTSARRRSSGTERPRVPIAPAIVWQDRRTAPLCEELRGAGHEALVRRRTGLLARPVLLGDQARWLLDNVPGARERAGAASSPSAPSTAGWRGDSPEAAGT